MRCLTWLLVLAALAPSALAPSALRAEPIPVLDLYTEVSKALAADDLQATQKAADELQKAAAKVQPELAVLAGQVFGSDSLASARQAFKPLSEQAVKMAGGIEGYHIMTCPMAKADWVQQDRQLANPYYGASMLRCGSVKK